MSIENLNKAIKKYKTKKRAWIKAMEKEKQKEREENRKFETKEKKLLSKKLQIYRKILEWKDNFVKTKQFKVLTEDEDGIRIYRGGWGHKKPSYGGYGCWSEIYLEKSGRLTYRLGYKSFPSEGFILDQKTFQKLSYDYLNKLHKDISSYKTIAQDVEELAKEEGFVIRSKAREKGRSIREAFENDLS